MLCAPAVALLIVISVAENYKKKPNGKVGPGDPAWPGDHMPEEFVSEVNSVSAIGR